MSEPRTIRELNASFSIFQKMVWTLIGFMGAFVIGAGAFYIQIGELKTDVAVIRANSATAVERLTSLDARVEKRLADLDQRLLAIDKNLQEIRADDRVLRAVGRVESLSQTSKLDAPVAGLYVTSSEASAIVQFLRPPIRSDKASTLTVGSRADESEIRPLPGDLLLKAPRLKGMRYVLDGNAIALIAPDTNVVFAIL